MHTPTASPPTEDPRSANPRAAAPRTSTPRAVAPRAATRDRALDAAHASILDIGAGRTTMVEVARRSGVGRTTLYRHWPDITALFADLLTRELTAAVARVDPSLPHSTPLDLDALADTLCAVADQIRADPLLDAMRRDESGLLAEYLLHRLGSSQRTLVGILREVLDRAFAADPRPVGREAAPAASMLYLAVQGAVLSAPLADPPLDPDTWRSELRRLIRGYLKP